MADSLVVGSKVREAVKAEGCNMSGEFTDALSAQVATMVKNAAGRASGNGRKTVRAVDL